MDDIGMLKGGLLAWLLWQGGFVNSGAGLVVYRRRGGRNNKYNANISMTMEDMSMRGSRGDVTQGYVIPAKGGNIRESIPGVSRFRADEPEGEGCSFAMLGMCGG